MDIFGLFFFLCLSCISLLWHHCTITCTLSGRGGIRLRVTERRTFLRAGQKPGIGSEHTDFVTPPFTVVFLSCRRGSLLFY